jgi:polyribonucleotide nucleotidyltransferase
MITFAFVMGNNKLIMNDIKDETKGIIKKEIIDEVNNDSNDALKNELKAEVRTIIKDVIKKEINDEVKTEINSDPDKLKAEIQALIKEEFYNGTLYMRYRTFYYKHANIIIPFIYLLCGIAYVVIVQSDHYHAYWGR